MTQCKNTFKCLTLLAILALFFLCSGAQASQNAVVPYAKEWQILEDEEGSNAPVPKQEQSFVCITVSPEYRAFLHAILDPLLLNDCSAIVMSYHVDSKWNISWQAFQNMQALKAKADERIRQERDEQPAVQAAKDRRLQLKKQREKRRAQ